jgi:hypothetical protein
MISQRTILAVAGLLASACASEDKAVTAEDVGYDNATSGLVSSTVQGAVDDIAVMSIGQDERLQAVEGRRNAISCRFATTSLSLPDGVPTTVHVFTAAECGGVLPDATYVGAAARFKTCSTSVFAVEAMNAGEPDGPGLVLTRLGTGACTGPAVLAAVFHKL